MPRSCGSEQINLHLFSHYVDAPVEKKVATKECRGCDTYKAAQHGHSKSTEVEASHTSLMAASSPWFVGKRKVYSFSSTHSTSQDLTSTLGKNGKYFWRCN